MDQHWPYECCCFTRTSFCDTNNIPPRECNWNRLFLDFSWFCKILFGNSSFYFQAQSHLLEIFHRLWDIISSHWNCFLKYYLIFLLFFFWIFKITQFFPYCCNLCISQGSDFWIFSVKILFKVFIINFRVINNGKWLNIFFCSLFYFLTQNNFNKIVLSGWKSFRIFTRLSARILSK